METSFFSLPPIKVKEILMRVFSQGNCCLKSCKAEETYAISAEGFNMYIDVSSGAVVLSYLFEDYGVLK